MNSESVTVVWADGSRTVFYPYNNLERKKDSIIEIEEMDSCMYLTCETGFMIKGWREGYYEMDTIVIPYFNTRMLLYSR